MVTPRETTVSEGSEAWAGTAVTPRQAAAVTAAASRRVGAGMADLREGEGRAFVCGSGGGRPGGVRAVTTERYVAPVAHRCPYRSLGRTVLRGTVLRRTVRTVASLGLPGVAVGRLRLGNMTDR